MNATFKSYSEKSKARRALVQVYGIDKDATDPFLTQVDGKHGFHLDVDNKPCIVQQDAGAALGTAAQNVIEAAQDVIEALEPQAQVEAKPEEEQVEPAASAFGAFAASQLTAASNSTPAAEPVRTSQRVEGLKIQKDREAQNGVKERSKGGLCRAVWDELNSLMTHDEATGLANVPTVAQIKKIAEEKGWNVNNASIEYYQWRKFHGISGRGKKQI